MSVLIFKNLGMKKLSVGCGNQKPEPNLVRLDISAEVNPDVVWDLDEFPYPFANSEFDEIECLDVIEHLADIPKTLEEFNRIIKPGGILKITTPHFSCANSYIDPTHKWHLSYFSFDFFCEGHQFYYYSNARYRIRNRCILFQKGWLNKRIMGKLANKFPKTYEQRWAWIIPAWFLYFELEAVK